MIEKILARLEAEADKSYNAYTVGFISDDRAEYDAYTHAIEIVQEVANEHRKLNRCDTCTYYEKGFEDGAESVRALAPYENSWISCSERLPSREECGKYGRKEFQVTIPQHDENATTAMDYEYTTVRGKEVARWLWAGRISPWKVLAWKPLDAPYQKGE